MGGMIVEMDGCGYYSGILILKSTFHPPLRNQFDESHILSGNTQHPKTERPQYAIGSSDLINNFLKDLLVFLYLFYLLRYVDNSKIMLGEMLLNVCNVLYGNAVFAFWASVQDDYFHSLNSLLNLTLVDHGLLVFLFGGRSR